MSTAYRLVQWTPHKKAYDLTIGLCVVGYLAAFFVLGKISHRGSHALSDEVLLIRAFGTCAIVMLHVILCIGPLCRLDRRFLPLLFNRRHLGVSMFLVALTHSVLSLGYYHGFGVTPAIISLLTANTQYASLLAFPFESLGIAALCILFLMAATSHDFWLKNLSPGAWKALHMLVYPAYAMVVLHVALGALQSEQSVIYPVMLLGGVLIVASLHLAAARAEKKKDGAARGEANTGKWIDVAAVDEIAEKRALVISLPGRERIAVYRYDGKVSAISNVCAHQHGPLGEGKIVGGCVTCPWHGYQYRPGDGCSPPPFSEKVPTYRVRIVGRRVLLDPDAMPAGVAVEPARVVMNTNSQETPRVTS